jgi:regulator of sigma E protease
MPQSWLFWVPVLVGLISVLVIVHESGHYLIARAFGMRVLRYSIGIGPVLFKYQPKDSPTVFQVCAIPFLAYVQIDGMNPTDEIDPKDPALFANKGVFARILTILGGPVANYLFASIVIFFLVLVGGERQLVAGGPMVVGSIQDGSPAASAGVELGDEVVEANGQAVHNIEELIAATRDRADQPTLYRVRRHGELLAPMTITPHADESQGGRAVIGITQQPRFEYQPASLGQAMQSAVIGPLNITILQLEAVADRIRARSTEGISGPVGMVRRMRESAEEGLYTFVLTLAVISVALGFFNLLPFPALDGGRLVFLFFELITRRRANERVEAVIHMVGIVVLLCFAAYVTIYRDIPG